MKTKAHGSHTIFSLADSRGEKKAMLSAAGPPLSIIWGERFMRSRPRILGTSKLEAGVWVRDVKYLIPQMCWTPDEDFVVIYDRSFYNFSVVDLKALEK